MVHPLIVLAVGLVIVIGLIVALRVHAFLALLTAALVVSALAPGDVAQRVGRVAAAFGATAANIGIVIALAAIIGQCMMQSGAADRVVRGFLSLLGEKRAGTALSASGFVLAVPVFFDTVFYLLVPLARSMFRRTGRHYLKYVMAIAAGGAITHTLVPPTPGPLVIADTLGVDLGTMILVGAAIAVPAAAVGLSYATWLDRRMPVPMRPVGGGTGAAAADELAVDEAAAPPGSELPGLLPSVLPIVLPVLLISTNTIVKTATATAGAGGDAGAGAGGSGALGELLAVAGDPNLALFLSAVIAIAVLCRARRPTRQQLARTVERALMSGGVIILITAAGGAFGAMLGAAGVGASIEGMFRGESAGGGLVVLLVAFGVASLLKIAQGSSTVAMITAAGMLAAMVDPQGLGFHPVYLAVAIGAGSVVGSWMNDSGFWIFAKMSGLTETEALKSWSVLLVLLGVTSMAVAVVLSLVVPLR